VSDSGRERESGPLARRLPVRAGLRAVNLLVYGGFCALGFGLCARPALLELRGLGLSSAALPWEVPLGRLLLLLALVIGCWTVRLMLASALGARVRLPERGAFLLTVAAALATRAAAGEPVAPRDPAPSLLEGLRVCAELLDQGYADGGHYQAAKEGLEERLSALPAPGFVQRGRLLGMHVRFLEHQTGAQLAALAGDPPGTLYVALDEERTRAWITALTLEGRTTAPLKSRGRALVLQARAGTHSSPGRDPAIPDYPRMELVHDRQK
jgi:hypothetical protein